MDWCWPFGAASGLARRRHMMDETTNVSLHAEGGHFGTQLEPPSTFEAEDYQRAAGVALGEGQNGMGTPLVNGDGSLMQNKLTHETTD